MIVSFKDSYFPWALRQLRRDYKKGFILRENGTPPFCDVLPFQINDEMTFH